jgi:RNase P subunit RPR2
LPEDQVEERLECLEMRDNFFRWHGDTGPAAFLALLGLPLLFLGLSSGKMGGVIVGFLVGGFMVSSGVYIQFAQSVPEESSEDEGDSTDSSKQHSSKEKTTGYHGGRPAGLWQCPNCGAQKRKGGGYTVVKCQECGAEMRFRKSKSENRKEKASNTGGAAPRERAKACVHDFTEKGKCRKCGWHKRSLKMMDSGSSTQETESGCMTAMRYILVVIGFLSFLQTCAALN